MAIATTNPATGEVLERYQEISDRELELCLGGAADAFKKQRLTTFPQRSGWMLRAAELLDAEQDDVARMMTIEMGKTVKSAPRRCQSAPGGAGTTQSKPKRFLPTSQQILPLSAPRPPTPGTNPWVWSSP